MLPTPQANESQTEFVARCSRALADEMPDSEKRNMAAYRQWKNTKGESEVEKLARTNFENSRFNKVDNVCIFAEHDTVNRAGAPQKYDLTALGKIIDRMNRRITETHTFCPLTEGHTPDEKDGSQPAVLGYYGECRLGQLPNGKYGIFADEFRYRDLAEKVSRLPGRSVEIWGLNQAMEDRFFHPVAALGAQAPRLELPMKFQQTAEGVEIGKYTAFAGDSNSFVPSTLTKEKYQVFTPEQQAEIQGLIMQCLQQAGIGAAPMAPAVPPVAPAPPAPPVPPVDDYEADDEPVTPNGDDPPPKVDDDMKDKDKFRKLETEVTQLRVEVAKYKRIDEEVAVLKADKTAAERLAKLMQLEHDGYVFRPHKYQRDGQEIEMSGLDREMERCVKMSDSEFNTHLVCIAENYQRLPANERQVPLYVPAGRAPQLAGPTEEQRRDAAIEARQRVEKYRAEGKPTKYEDVLATVLKERNLEGVAA